MVEIKTLNDIRALEGGVLPKEMLENLTADFKANKEWSDYENQYTIENFNSDFTGYGEIIVLDGTETVKELEERIGLTGGLDATIPESVDLVKVGYVVWRRILVVYNDSYANVIWVPGYSRLDSYAAA